MDTDELLWLKEVVPLLYKALQSLKKLETTKAEPRSRAEAPSPPPLPEPRPDYTPSPRRKRRKVCHSEPKNNRKIWVKEENLNRDADGLFATTFEQIYMNNHDEFKSRTGMTPQVFDMLFCLVGEQLNKNSIRTPIAPECRLFLTLVYLANAERVADLSKAFKMGPSTVRVIVQETCEVLWTTLAPAFLPQPNAQDLKQIAEGYEQTWNLPHCLGAVDAKLLDIIYKGDKDIVLLASCDANLAFSSIDIASVSDAAKNQLNWHLDFASQLFMNQLGDLLPAEPLDASCAEAKVGYSYIAGADFPMREHLIVPFAARHAANDQRQFDQRLSRVLSASIGKAFDVLISRWRVLAQPLPLSPANAEKIVRATVVLHNFVRLHDESYCPPSYLDDVAACEAKTKVPSAWLRNVEQPLPPSSAASQLRDFLKAWMSRNHVEHGSFDVLVKSVVWAAD